MDRHIMQGASGRASCQEQGGSIMATAREILKIVGIAGLTLLIGQGCSQKSVRVTADSETFDQGAQYWANSGPLAGLQEYGGRNGGNWASGQGYRNGQGGSMAEEFIQEDYDNIAEAQPFSSRGLAQGAQSGQSTRVQVELQDVFFEFNSWRISQEGRQALAHDAEWLDQNQSRSITVEGHCDQRGSRDYNLVLGKKRAGAVHAYLVDLGVETHKIQVISYGKERPFCFGNDPQCYQLNRRGHMQLHH